MYIATTTLLPLHANKQSIAQVLGRTTDYVKNPEKTNDGEYISAYECDPLIAESEFLFAKRQYETITGRNQGSRDVVAYHVRQSFKPGEVEPEEANKIGYELAMSLTKGKNAFLVCTHIDKAHVHSHIIINSTTLDCKKKFRNFKNSTFAIRRISNQLCLQHGLSVIENPSPKRSMNHSEWEKSKMVTDNAVGNQNKFNLLIDVQQKMQEGKGEGFRHWATLRNIRDMSKTLIYLQENKLTEYEKLEAKAKEAAVEFHALSGQIKQRQTRIDEIKELQKYISQYGKTREAYKIYLSVPTKERNDFFEEHRADITLHKAAKNFFDSQGYGKDKKLPKMDSLKQEYARLSAEKNKLYSQYKAAKQSMIDLCTAKSNTDRMLNIKPKVRSHDFER